MQFLSLSRVGLTAAALSIGLVSAAQAAQVATRFGDQDGFGIGVGSGDEFRFGELINPTALGTDDWTYGGFTAQVSSAWTGNLIGGQLQVFSGGWGLDGDAGVYLNNTLVGLLTNGDDGGSEFSRAYLDSFNLTPFLALLTGSNQIEIRTVNPNDGGVLGYLKLILQTQDAGGGNSVPEPASAALAGLALVAALAARRRRI